MTIAGYSAMKSFENEITALQVVDYIPRAKRPLLVMRL